MKDHLDSAQREILQEPKKLIVTPSIGSELFMPEKIAEEPRLREYISERQALHSLLKEVFDQSKPGKPLQIDDETAQKLMESLSDFILRDENNGRILLYLPFELLPDLTDTKRESAERVESELKFGTVYRDAWIRLLHEFEPRASFSNGDVLEPGLGDPEMISKAGHLIPEILPKGIISVEDIVALLDIMTDPRALKPLAEGVTVARAKGLINDDDWETISDRIDRRLPQIKLGPALYDESSFDSMSPARTEWLQRVDHQRHIESQAQGISKVILVGGLEALDMSIDFENTSYWVPVLHGIFSSAHHSRIARDTKLFFSRMLETGNPQIESVMIEGLSRWMHVGIVDSAYISDLGVRIPDLASSQPVDVHAISEDLNFLSDAAKKINEDPELSQALYPTFLVFGSRMKGYAHHNSDYDGAIFFRPHVLPDERERILSRLATVAPEIAKIDSLLEYWMHQENDELTFIQHEDNPSALGFDQVHFFLGGAWISHGSEYAHIQRDILEQYLDLSRYRENQESVRTAFLGRLELDVLQYRLMHSGYHRFYPTRNAQETEHDAFIDGQSAFWDAGYRRVATQLFLSRVFLPNLS